MYDSQKQWTSQCDLKLHGYIITDGSDILIL